MSGPPPGQPPGWQVSVTEAPAAIVIPAGCASRFVFGLSSEMMRWGVEPTPPRTSDFMLKPPVMVMTSLPGEAIVKSQDPVGVPLVQFSVPMLPLPPFQAVTKTPGVTGQDAADAPAGRAIAATIAISAGRS